MSNLTIVFWRDIPAQLLIGSGRKATKLKLSEKFEKAIDRCAMKVGAKDSQSYLDDWQKKQFPWTLLIQIQLNWRQKRWKNITLLKS